mgnify:CR=1 FL=1
MYKQFWGLNEKPFENTPDPKFIYYSRQHEEALTRMLYAIREGKGAAMLTGEYGCGKTILSRIVINDLIKNDDFEVALVIHPRLTPVEFMEEIIYQLKNEHVKGSKPKLLHILQETIYEHYRQNKRTVIIIDEAQLIDSEEAFEELRLLLNFQLNDRFLITLVLIGQPELLPKVSAIPQLDQRIGVKYHLSALDEEETKNYIQYRMEVAGAARPIFTPEAIHAVYCASQGVPRRINNICDTCLLVGFGQEVKEVDKDLVDKVALEFN